MPPVEKSVESFGFKIVNWNVDGDDLGGDKNQTGDNQPKNNPFLKTFDADLLDFHFGNCSNCTSMFLCHFGGRIWETLTL